MTENNTALPKSAQSALSIISGEHQGFATALNSLMRHLTPVRERRVNPNYDLFGTILSYIDTFMDRLHHPKEDEHLFRAVRTRTTEADAVLLELQHGHARGPADFRELHEALRRTRGGSAAEIETFAIILDRYAAESREHMRKEGSIVVPIALKVLTQEDWETIDHAFRDNRDPFFGTGPQGRDETLFKARYGFPSAGQ
ncbi:MAG: hemerythrin domain-containing protein [Betaproteobacteria bacterium]|nr:hemerythrin domain-containing protein [Betaproteobacteria bacterium]